MKNPQNLFTLTLYHNVQLLCPFRKFIGMSPFITVISVYSFSSFCTFSIQLNPLYYWDKWLGLCTYTLFCATAGLSTCKYWTLFFHLGYLCLVSKVNTKINHSQSSRTRLQNTTELRSSSLASQFGYILLNVCYAITPQ